MTAGRPRIAIPEIEQNLTVKNYTGAISEAGMEPVVVSVQARQLNGSQREYVDYGQFSLEHYDGLLLPGGGDINPARYGEENRGSMWIQDELDELQLRLLRDFTAAGKPVLGICRGLQLINVFFGGSLYQNLDTAARHVKLPGGADQVHESDAAGGSWIEALYGTRFPHNSAHHQAVKRLGEGLVPDCWSVPDGVVEAFHHRELPVFGVQWHPERMCLACARGDTPDGLPVFRFFCGLLGGDPSARAREAASPVMEEWVII